MNYKQLKIEVTEPYKEILIAELFDIGFEGFEELDNGIIASIPDDKLDEENKSMFSEILASMNAKLLAEELIKPQNWNQKWEQSIQPQEVGKFYITPTWNKKTPPNSDLIKIYIDPKMAFGTGYHATTRLILEILPDVINKGDKVLDAGTGTGILGIGALKLGAQSVFGFDIDEWSEENSAENIKLNDVSNFEVKLGSTEVIPKDEKYDVILANINRNALVELTPTLIRHLKENGRVILSGLLVEDEEYILSLNITNPLSHKETRKLSEWIALIFEA